MAERRSDNRFDDEAVDGERTQRDASTEAAATGVDEEVIVIGRHQSPGWPDQAVRSDWGQGIMGGRHEGVERTEPPPVSHTATRAAAQAGMGSEAGTGFSQNTIPAGYQVYRGQPERKRRRRWPWLLGLLLLAVGAGAIGYLFAEFSSPADETEVAEPAAPDTEETPAEDGNDTGADGEAVGEDEGVDATEGGGDDETEGVDATEGGGDDETEGVDATEGGGDGETDDGATTGSTPAGSGSSLRFELEDYNFTAEGVVPSEEAKEAIETRMGLVFAQFGTSNITVDPSVEPAPWLDAAPSVINTMILLHEGTIDIGADGTVVTGRGLENDFAALETRLSPDLGFPPFSIGEQDVIDKPAPWVRAIAPGDGTVSLTGELADETMQSTIVEGAKEVYGEENVTDDTTVDPGRHNRFLIMRFPSNLRAYRGFGKFDIRGENESFTAILEDGLVFETLETNLTEESRDRLSAVMFTLTRNPLPVAVLGHTDSVGSDADNLILSEQRAASVAHFLEESGVLPENITIEGRGEIDPIDTNATDEGRARNRRVEITVGLPDGN